MPGSTPLRARDEEFARLVASGMTLIESWCQSVEPSVVPTAGRRVSASKAGKRCAERIAYLKAHGTRSALVASDDDALTAERLNELMQATTNTIRVAAEVAQRVGALSLAQGLRKVAVTHAGRAQRVERRAPKIDEVDPQVPKDVYLSRLKSCECQT